MAEKEVRCCENCDFCDPNQIDGNVCVCDFWEERVNKHNICDYYLNKYQQPTWNNLMEKGVEIFREGEKAEVDHTPPQWVKKRDRKHFIHMIIYAVIGYGIWLFFFIVMKLGGLLK